MLAYEEFNISEGDLAASASERTFAWEENNQLSKCVSLTNIITLNTPYMYSIVF